MAGSHDIATPGHPSPTDAGAFPFWHFVPPPPYRGSLSSRGATLYPIEFLLAPEGSIGRGRKGVKKNAALLHFLAFAFSDHIIGVPRGEQPLGRGSLPRNSETFFASFFGHKKGRSNGRMTLIRESGRKVAANESRKQ